MRLPLKGFLTSRNFCCPLAPGQLDFSDEANPPWPEGATQLFANFYIYASWKYNAGASGADLSGPGMLHLGDSLGFRDVKNGNKEMRTHVLAMDRHLNEDTNLAQLTHPDKAGVMTPIVSQNGAYGPVNVFGYGEGHYTFCEYQDGVADALIRGPVDLNYGMTDGSVLRLNDVLYRDDRMASAPAHSDTTAAPTWHGQIPTVQ